MYCRELFKKMTTFMNLLDVVSCQGCHFKVAFIFRFDDYFYSKMPEYSRFPSEFICWKKYYWRLLLDELFYFLTACYLYYVGSEFLVVGNNIISKYLPLFTSFLFPNMVLPFVEKWLKNFDFCQSSRIRDSASQYLSE